jgi:sucrase/ferredoxin-like protein
MLGTAFPAQRVLVVEQPGAWGRDGLPTSDFDAALGRELLRRTAAAGVRLLAVRRPGRTPAQPRRRWWFADCRPGRQSLRQGTYSSDSDLLDLELAASSGEPDGEALVLVCTHGSHDVCCAVRGRPVAAALDAVLPGRVWECSHIGGDRFAANVLVLPSGLMYGQVVAAAAAEFAQAVSADEVVGGLLRGQVGLVPVAQAALAYGYQHLAVRERAELAVESVGAVHDGSAPVLLRTPHGPMVVTVRVETVGAEGLTCASPGPGRFTRYRPISITGV